MMSCRLTSTPSYHYSDLICFGFKFVGLRPPLALVFGQELMLDEEALAGTPTDGTALLRST